MPHGASHCPAIADREGDCPAAFYRLFWRVNSSSEIETQRELHYPGTRVVRNYAEVQGANIRDTVRG